MHGICYVETMNLDGETNFKLKQSIEDIKSNLCNYIDTGERTSRAKESAADVEELFRHHILFGNVISCGLFLSPMTTYIQIIQSKDVKKFSPIPYLATLLNCLLWFFYGLPIVHPNSLLVITINGIGIAFEVLYITVFLIYSSRQGRLKVIKLLALETLFMIVVVTSVLLLIDTTTKRSLIVGILCIIFGTCMYASPLVVMKLVIQTKSVEFMPFTLSLASFLNGVCWTSYGFLPFDINLLVPNGLGTLFGIAQLLLYACYFKATPNKIAHAELELSV
ncbi:bidirectional sugar transporter SWEET5-like [Zingiber officinale]|uniref:bidirectional sugar transporter SWEET5-like n=1 Tax=Zingiber officinale TaxID=94328 RepID=UPI001C4A9F6D|nr:bidirectional sugar transporter SWEET5-like [Zingiber officinale]